MDPVSWPIVVAEDLDIRIYRSSASIGIERVDLSQMDAWDSDGNRLELMPTLEKRRLLGLFPIDQDAVQVRLVHPVRSEGPALVARLSAALRADGASVPDGMSVSDALALSVARFGAT